MQMGAALAWDGDHCELIVNRGKRDTHLVNRMRARKARRRQARIGAPGATLTTNAGLAAVSELRGRLGLIEAIDAATGPVKQRDRGFTAGELLAGSAPTQLAGRTIYRAGPAARRRCGPAEAGMAAATGRVMSLLPTGRALAQADGPVTVDLDTTEVEITVKKRGVAYHHQGQRAAARLSRSGRRPRSRWPPAWQRHRRPRATAADLLRRALALANLPAAVCAGRVAVRADAGYFAGQLARAARDEHISFAIGAKRTAPL
jgi:hypothetical protein